VTVTSIVVPAGATAVGVGVAAGVALGVVVPVGDEEADADPVAVGDSDGDADAVALVVALTAAVAAGVDAGVSSSPAHAAAASTVANTTPVSILRGRLCTSLLLLLLLPRAVADPRTRTIEPPIRFLARSGTDLPAPAGQERTGKRSTSSWSNISPVRRNP
jgi:hypothetical protein